MSIHDANVYIQYDDMNQVIVNLWRLVADWLFVVRLFAWWYSGMGWETVKKSKFSRYNCTTDWIRLKIRRDEIEVNLIWWKNFSNDTIFYQTNTHTHRHTVSYISLYCHNIYHSSAQHKRLKKLNCAFFQSNVTIRMPEIKRISHRNFLIFNTYPCIDVHKYLSRQLKAEEE